MPLKLHPPRKGSPNWRIRGTYIGIPVDRSARTSKKSVAQKILKEIERQIEAGEFSRPGDTFAGAVAAYIKDGGERRYLKPLLGHFALTPLARIDQAAINEAAAVLYPPGISAEPSPHNATINRQVHTPMSAILKAADHPLLIKRPKQPKPKPRFLEPEEAAIWLEACNPKLRRFSIFLLYTGCRVTEACNVYGRDVSLARKSAYLPETKTGEDRIVHLPPVVISALKEIQIESDSRVFGYRDRWEVYDDWNPLRERLDFPKWWTPHACCHTWATWMRQYAGLDLRGLLGTGRWKSLKSVLRYTHVKTTEESQRADNLPDVQNLGSKGKKDGKSVA